MNKEIKEIEVTNIRVNPNQPRKTFNDNSIKELALSIKENGLIQPIIVRVKNNHYELIAGERRLRAIKYLQYSKIDAIIQDSNDDVSQRFAIIENIQRENLSPIEEAVAYQKLLNEYHLSQNELSKQLGKSQSSIANKIRLLNLDDSVQKYILDKKISERHGRAILKIKDNKQQKDILNKVINDNMNVKETEDYINQLLDLKIKKRKALIKKNDYRLEINTIKKSLDVIEKTGVKVECNIKQDDNKAELIIILEK